MVVLINFFCVFLSVSDRVALIRVFLAVSHRAVLIKTFFDGVRQGNAD